MVELSEFMDASRFYDVFLFLVAMFLVCAGPAYCAQEMKVFRLHQIDISGTPLGSRTAVMSLEATGQLSATPSRQCLLLRLADMSLQSLQLAVDQGAGGILVLLPEALHNVSETHREMLQSIEAHLLSSSFNMPIYMSLETPQMLKLYQDVMHDSQSTHERSATDALWSVVSSTGHQLEAVSVQNAALPTARLHNLEGRLHGLGVEEQLPTIALVAHYDSAAAAPGLSLGADSNGSGVSVLLELMRLFGRLYRHKATHPRYNLVFLLAAGGKLNYAGTRRWLDDNVDLLEASGPQGIQFVMCLDSLGKGNELNFHVSKPPKPDSSAARFFQLLEDSAREATPEMKVNLVHKKINLGERSLAWEHEVYSMRRLSAFTLSHHKTAWSPWLATVMDTRETVQTDTIVRNTRVIAEALARLVYGLDQPGSLVFNDELDVSVEAVDMWLDLLTSSPRAAQLMTDSTKEPIASLSILLQKELHNARLVSFAADRRQPEWQLYETAADGRLVVQRVKPAAFELAASLLIAAYLGLVYLAVNSFPLLYGVARRVSPVGRANAAAAH